MMVSVCEMVEHVQLFGAGENKEKDWCGQEREGQKMTRGDYLGLGATTDAGDSETTLEAISDLGRQVHVSSVAKHKSASAATQLHWHGRNLAYTACQEKYLFLLGASFTDSGLDFVTIISSSTNKNWWWMIESSVQAWDSFIQNDKELNSIWNLYHLILIKMTKLVSEIT